MAQDNLVGHTLGQYTVMERLGRGGMADVYKAFHPQLEVARAIKVIRPEFVTASDFRARFQKEAQAVAALRHPNIVQIHDFGEQENAYYMVMEYVQGQDLKRIIQAEGRIRPISRAVNIVDQVAEALHYAHTQGLIHRDIKPENIMINEDGLPILMDFGIAKLLTASTQLTQTGLGVGTPAYMAPEQAKALPEIGAAADIYSLSVVLYELLTGQVPYSADTPMAVMLKAISDPIPLPRTFSKDITDDLQQVVLKGMAKDPGNRYANARQFQEALGHATQDQPTTAVPAATELVQPQISESGGAGGRTQDPGTRKYRHLGLAAVAGAAAIGVVLYLLKPEPEKFAEAPEPTQQEAQDRQVAEGETGDTTAEETTPDDTGATAARDDTSRKLVEQQVSTEPGKPLEFPIKAEQGDVLYLQVFETSETTDFTLTAPDGRTAVFNAYNDHGPVSLGADGRYTLSALTRGNKTAELDFALWRLDPATIDGGALSFGEYTKGRTTVPGQTVSYTLTAEAGQTLFFDLAEYTETTDFTLTAPDGRSEVFQHYNDRGPFTLEQSGTYTLLADPRSDKTSDFEFVVWHVDPATIDGGALSFGEYTKGRTTVPGQTVSYTLTAEAGQTLFFDLAEYTETTDFTLTAPDGRSEVFQHYNDRGPFTLEQSGTYTLLADPRSDKTSDFEFVVWHVDPATIDGGALSFGEYTKGRTTVPGQTVSYTLTAEAGQTLFFDLAEYTETTDFTLTAPDGRSEVFHHYNDRGPFTLEQSGTYTLLADPRSDKTSDFEFVVWHVDPATIDGGALSFGEYTKGRTTVPGQTVSYTLTAEAGQTLFFDLAEYTETTDFTLTAPDGRSEVFQHYNDRGPFTLEQSGTYTLLADPRSDKTSDFEFMVRPEK